MNDKVAHRAVTPDDLYRLKLLEAAQFAPNGTHIVYSVAQMERAKDAPADDPDTLAGTAAQLRWYASREARMVHRFGATWASGAPRTTRCWTG